MLIGVPRTDGKMTASGAAPLAGRPPPPKFGIDRNGKPDVCVAALSLCFYLDAICDPAAPMRPSPCDAPTSTAASKKQLLASYAAALGVKHMIQGHHHNDVKFADGAERHTGEMFQRWGLLFLIDVGMSREIGDSQGAALKITRERAVAVWRRNPPPGRPRRHRPRPGGAMRAMSRSAWRRTGSVPVSRQHGRRCRPQVHQKQGVQNVRETGIDVESQQLTAGLEILADQHGDAFAVSFDIRDGDREVLDAGGQRSQPLDPRVARGAVPVGHAGIEPGAPGRGRLGASGTRRSARARRHSNRG